MYGLDLEFIDHKRIFILNLQSLKLKNSYFMEDLARHAFYVHIVKFCFFFSSVLSEKEEEEKTSQSKFTKIVRPIFGTVVETKLFFMS